ncbi:formate dehydrogenase accessory sulfurtransferase FdhD [Nocardioides sp. AE5]|uniref:formate dehydrogenase accessory sulfurtransferase FdhD n=1 Tax=Nocardioides sp. AE5 TaxID=2962573 RepID=UPI002880CFDD|nr:formate dehydrogenase accessory sulfurtransferase FdhD [Nocardioides sp. AE5]MDT0202253.1 formate dehydrogenase accessory sulfurtransferase FdhD [Nocardioides sp. AE5]
MGRTSDRRRVTRIRGTRASARPDTLAVEEPLEIRVNGEQYAVTMRTPGDDFELAVGFLVAEGVLGTATDVARVRFCEDGRPDPTYNVVDVTLADGVAPPHTHRHHAVTSSCGICGRDSLDAVRTAARWSVADDDLHLTAATIAALPARLRAGQGIFDRTGGLHAAGLFAADGTLLCLREDVGRHNAVDKVIGWALLEGHLPLRGRLLQLSGRVSFELVQKAWLAGIPLISAVSAPSTLAVDLAREAGITLAGFVRGGTMNLYAGEHRVGLPEEAPVTGPGAAPA